MTEVSGCFLYSVILASAWDKTIKITVLVLTLRGSQEDYSPQLLFNFLCLNKISKHSSVHFIYEYQNKKKQDASLH